MEETNSELENLRQDNQRLRRALNSATSGIIVLDSSKVVRFVNAGWAAMHGLSPQIDILGKALEDVLFTSEQIVLLNEALSVVDKADYWEGTIEGIRHNGKERLLIWISIAKSQKVQDDGSQDYVLIGTDYTKQRLREMQLEDAKDQLKKHSRELEQLTSVMTGRELKMIELKQEIEQLNKKLKKCLQ